MEPEKISYLVCCFLAGMLGGNIFNAFIGFLVVNLLFYGTGVL